MTPDEVIGCVALAVSFFGGVTYGFWLSGLAVALLGRTEFGKWVLERVDSAGAEPGAGPGGSAVAASLDAVGSER